MAARREREIYPMEGDYVYKTANADNGRILYYRQLIEDNPALKKAVLKSQKLQCIRFPSQRWTEV